MLGVTIPYSDKVLMRLHFPWSFQLFGPRKKDLSVADITARQGPRSPLLICEHNTETEVVGGRDPETLSKERAWLEGKG